MKILYLIHSLQYSGAAKQLSLLAPALPRDRFEVCVGILHEDGPFGELMRKAGVRVETVGRRHRLALEAAAGLSRLLADFRPDLVHAWGPATGPIAWLASLWARAALVINSPALPARPGLLDRLLLRRVARVIAMSKAEADRCRRWGVAADKVVQVRPAVAAAEQPVESAKEPPSIVCVGPFERSKGFRDAVWTFDILRYVEDTVQLVLVGDGPDRDALERFAAVTGTTDRVRLVGRQADLGRWLAEADLVWVPSLVPAGFNVVLEAMALGKPIIATRVRGMDEIVIDGDTGFLIAPGDKTALARRTQQLLNDAELRQRLGNAGRQRATDQFGVAQLTEQVGALYGVTVSTPRC